MRVFKCELCGDEVNIRSAGIKKTGCVCGGTKHPLIAKTEPVAEVPCSAGLSDAVFTEEYGVLSFRAPEGWLLWHSCKVDGVTLAEILKEAEENLKKLKETQGR